ncbi:hypothetical protein D3C75_1217560 [compost metagenome]
MLPSSAAVMLPSLSMRMSWLVPAPMVTVALLISPAAGFRLLMISVLPTSARVKSKEPSAFLVKLSVLLVEPKPTLTVLAVVTVSVSARLANTSAEVADALSVVTTGVVTEVVLV